MPKGYPIGVQNVHEYLWELSDSRGLTKIDHANLMDRYQCTKHTASRLIRQLVAEGRVSQVTKRRYRKGLFKIADPSAFEGTAVSTFETEIED